MKTKEQVKEVAFDIALEIILGADRLDREDFRRFVRKHNLFSELENIKSLTEKNCIDLQKDVDPIFLDDYLNYWFEPFE